jgi:dethiobiotin synthetase
LRRPDLLVVVAGTGTEVGKTWATAALARGLRDRGLTVAARKPAQSFEPGAGPTDAEVLAEATGEEAADVCRPDRNYEVAMAPPMAADALGRPVPSIAELAAEITWPDGPAAVDVGFVESAGGVASPLAGDGDTVALVEHLHPDVVLLVADAGLGTLNAVRLSGRALAPWPVVVLLNRFDPTVDLHRRNRAWLVERDGVDAVTDVRVLVDRGPDWSTPTGSLPPTSP